MRIYTIFFMIMVFMAHIFTQISAQEVNKKTSSFIPEKKSMKSIATGYGQIFFTHKTKVNNVEVEGAINDLGVSIGLKAIEHFYQISAFDAGIGYYVSGNTILGFSLSAYAKKLESAPTRNSSTSAISGTVVLSYGEQGIIKTIAQNINFGINFYSKAPFLTTNVGIGPSVNFLFFNFSDADSRFMSTIGIGGSLDIEFHFPITQLIAIPLVIHAAYYPLNFNSYDATIQYGIESAVILAIQLGVTFTY